ncbi:hypothetical protein BDR06DRAFT_971677 [Suillus hirtellus]|nr:hypothetical protein BDR06DRAFT_971677 [Suillus hirtellus]
MYSGTGNHCYPYYRNAASVTGFGEDLLANPLSTQFNSFNPNAGNTPVKPGPLMMPHMASMPSQYYASIVSYFPEFYGPILSNDGISMMPDPEDLLPLDIGQPLPINEPLHSNVPSQSHLEHPLPAQPSRKHCQGIFIPFDPCQKQDVAPSPAPSQPIVTASNSRQSTSQKPGVGPAEYDENHMIHKEIVQMALETIIRSILNKTPFLFEDEQKQQVHSALVEAVCAFAEEDSAKRWTLDNESMLYRILSAPSVNVMSIAKKHAHNLVPCGYNLCLPLSSVELEPKHQVKMVKNLIKQPPFPLRYLLKTDGVNTFENDVLQDIVQDIVQNTVIELGYLQYIIQESQLDSLYCTATITVHCVLLGLKGGGNENVEFSVKVFKSMHMELMTFIKEYINPHKQ